MITKIKFQAPLAERMISRAFSYPLGPLAKRAYLLVLILGTAKLIQH